MNNIIDLYARAAAVLYGIISFDDFFKILDNYYGEKALSKEHIMLYFWTSENEDPIYYIQDELIVHASIPPNDVARTLSEIQYPLGATAPAHHIILPEKEFLHYANPCYFEDTSGTRDMAAYLADLGLSPEDIREIVAEMVFICRTGTCPTFLMDALSRRGIPTEKGCILDLMTIGCEIEAGTRQWERLGATGGRWLAANWHQMVGTAGKEFTSMSAETFISAGSPSLHSRTKEVQFAKEEKKCVSRCIAYG